MTPWHSNLEGLHQVVVSEFYNLAQPCLQQNNACQNLIVYLPKVAFGSVTIHIMGEAAGFVSR